MSDLRTNIFSLSEVYELQKEGFWVNTSREAYRNYQYLVGGAINGVPTIGVSSSFRIDFSNDTRTIRRGTLAWRLGAISSNLNFAYLDINPETTFQRISYSNDLIASQFRSVSLIPTFLRRGRSGFGNINFGYFSGGWNENPQLISNVERLNYANDVVSPTMRGPLEQAIALQGSYSTSDFGWVTGGGGISSPISISKISRITYANDMNVARVRSFLPTIHRFAQGAGNSNFGWIISGQQVSYSSLSTVARLNYSNDLVTPQIRGPLPYAAGGVVASSGNSNYALSHNSVYQSNNNTQSNRIDYSNDTNTPVYRDINKVSSSWGRFAAVGAYSFGGAPQSYLGKSWISTAPYGYFGGGIDGSISTIYSHMGRIDYANDTENAALRGTLFSALNSMASTGNSSFGWFAGGGSPTVSSISRLDYLTDTNTTSLRGPLSIVRTRFAATGTSNFGYFAGSNGISSIDRVSYSSDLVAAITRGPLNVGRQDLIGLSNINYGYFTGGASASTTILSRLDYSNDTSVNQVRNVSTQRFSSSATGNENFGYVVNGTTTSPTNILLTEKINYANDTASLLRVGTISNDRSAMGATGNSNSGYFAGGFNSIGRYSTIDKIDYSSDTQISTIRGPLTVTREYIASTSSQSYGGAPSTTTSPIPTYINSMLNRDPNNALIVPQKRVLGSFGYFVGTTSNSGQQRLDFSNDLVAASPRSFLSLVRQNISAIGNRNYGYFGGGYLSDTSGVSTVERLNYTNDNIVNTRGPLESSFRFRSGLCGTNFGYFAGGIALGTTRTNIDRLTFSNDTSIGTLRTNLIQSKCVMSPVGNINFGYYGGGVLNVSNVRTTMIERLSYSNDGVVPNIRANLLSVRNLNFITTFGAAGNSNFGYFGGGNNGVSTLSSLERIDYSNDLQILLPRGPLTQSINALVATGNSNFGWFASVSTRTDRINYSNDTLLASIRGPILLSGSDFVATTNARNS